MIKQKIDNFTKSQEEGLLKLEAFLSTKIDINDINTRVFLLEGKAGSGKAQPITSKIQTPFGEKELKDLKIGDSVYAANGLATCVSGIFPQGKRKVYKITFSDGTETLSDIEHIWNVRRTSGNAKKSGFKNKTLKEIIQNGTHYGKLPHTELLNRYERNIEDLFYEKLDENEASAILFVIIKKMIQVDNRLRYDTMDSFILDLQSLRERMETE